MMTSGKTIRRLLACALVAFTLTGTLAQVVRRGFAEEPKLDHRIRSESGVVQVPFELVHNHVLIPVSVNGSEPFRCILDTGMPGAGIVLYGTDRVEALGLEFDPGMRAQVGGAGGSGKRVEANVAHGLTFDIGDLEMAGGRAIVFPPVEHFTDYHDGVIGAALFLNFVVRLDYDSMTLTLQEPDEFRAPEGALELPIELRHRLPYARGSVTTLDGASVPVLLVVDLGASPPVSLNAGSHEDLTIPVGSVKTTIGRGLSGRLTGHVGRIRSLELAGKKLTNVLATFPDSEFENPRGVDARNGVLGSGVLKHFNVTFDYAGKRMLLEPNKSFTESFEWDMSGILFRGDRDREFWVEALLPDSPAEKAGLKVDDVLTDVDGRPVAALGLHEVKELLRQDGKEVVLGLQRGADRIEVTLTLRRLV